MTFAADPDALSSVTISRFNNYDYYAFNARQIKAGTADMIIEKSMHQKDQTRNGSFFDIGLKQTAIEHYKRKQILDTSH